MSKKTMLWNYVLAVLLDAVVSLNAVAKTDDGSEASAFLISWKYLQKRLK